MTMLSPTPEALIAALETVISALKPMTLIERSRAQWLNHELKSGTDEAKIAVLGRFATINAKHNRGATQDEARKIAERAGYDPRGIGVFYSLKNPPLVQDENGRWITEEGLEWLTARGWVAPEPE